MVSLQTEFCPVLPPVFAGKDFHEQQALLARMDAVLYASGLEAAFIASFPRRQRRTDKKRRRLVTAIRCTILRIVYQLSYVRMSSELACNYEYQKFCGLLQLDRIVVPSAKTLERYEKSVPAKTVSALAVQLNLAAAAPADAHGGQVLDLETPVEPGVAYVDTTALKAPVHHPVDWLLLRDAVRTLTLAITQARKHGICSRMPRAPKA